MESTSGQFFFRASYLASSIEHQRYCYKKIARKTKPEKETDYPIYVTIGADSVFFQCSAYHDGSSQKLEHYGAGKIQEFSFTLEFQNSISLWLSNQEEIAPSFIDPKLYHRYENDEDICFSNLKKLPLPARSDSEQVLLTHRELVLDFLFDLFHSNVFNGNPAVRRLRAALQINPLSRAILAKADFYFYEKSYLANIRPMPWSENQHKKDWLADRFFESARKWLGCLRLKEVENEISLDMSNNLRWFEDIESEHKNIYVFLRSHNQKGEQENEIKEEYSESSRWLAGRYKFFSALFPYFTNTYKAGNLFILVLCFFASIVAATCFAEPKGQESTWMWIPRIISLLLGIVLPLSFGLERVMSLVLSLISLLSNSAWYNVFWVCLFSVVLYYFGGIVCTGVFLILVFFLNGRLKNCFSDVTDIFFSIPKLARIFMPKAFISGLLLLLWLPADGDHSLQLVKELSKSPILFYGLLVALLFCCFAFMVSKFVPMLPMPSPAKRFRAVFQRSFSLFFRVFPYCFLMVLVFDLALSDSPQTSIQQTCLLALIATTFGIVVELGTTNFSVST